MKSQLELIEQFEQGVLFDSLLDEPSFLCKKMFGGLSCYYDGKMVACLVEGEIADTLWKGKDYGRSIWRGILLPTEYDHQASLLQDITGLSQHPVLKKWLYLPLEAESYDESAQRILSLIRRRDSRIGILPGSKNKKRNPSLRRQSRP